LTRFPFIYYLVETLIGSGARNRARTHDNWNHNPSATTLLASS